MINIILVDDEQPALDELEFLLQAYDQVNIVAKFNEPKKALEYILLHEVDAIFLDISMPQLDGFTMAEAIIRLRKPPHIIFATAYDDYAIKAFEVNAIDYLLKPITETRLVTTINRLKNVIHSSKEANSKKIEEDTLAIKKLLSKRYKDTQITRLPLWKNDRIHLINPNDISFIETKDGETMIYSKKGLFTCTESLSHFEDILSTYSFFRCHRSYLIQINSIAEVIPWFNNTYAVKITGYDVEIPVSRRNVKEFKELLNL